MENVKLKTSWYELLGQNREDMPDDVRRARWNKWKRMAIGSGDKDIVDCWTDSSHCGDCIHRMVIGVN